jgi:hypothetical protein
VKEVFWLSLLMIGMKVESRREYNEEIRYKETLNKLNTMFSLTLESIPHGDTLAQIWKKIRPEEIETLRELMIKRLIRGKHLDAFRLNGRFLIAVDGVEFMRDTKRHCENCLTAKIKGIRYYFHQALDAKIICPNGLALSIATEFIENTGEYDKQDCELKAFKRLAKKIKQLYPRLPIVLLLDGLYPNGPVFEICRENEWKYIIVLPDACLESVWEVYNGLNKLEDMDKRPKATKHQLLINDLKYQWQNEIAYEGTDFIGTVNVLSVSEKEANGDWTIKRAFITNFKIKDTNVVKFDSHGKLRWKIENEGFNTQKNGGVYNLEHLYCKHPNAMKIVYYLIQITHIINQLNWKCNLLKINHNYPSLRKFLKTLLDTLTTIIFSEKDLENWKILQNSSFNIKWA